MEKGMKEIYVVKRNGDKELLNLDKIHIMVEHACRGLAGVSESQVEMNANLQFFDGIETKDIQEILIRSANDLISLEGSQLSVCCCSSATVCYSQTIVWTYA